MPQYQTRDEQTGKTVTFEWHGAGEPTEADMADVFAEAAAMSPSKPTFRGGGELGQLIRDQESRPARAAEFKENLPAVGSALAGTLATLGSGGIALPAVAAAGGAYLGARGRGDSREDAAFTGVKDGVLSAALPIIGKGLAKIAPPLYRAAIPKPIQDKFSQADLAGAGLKAKAWLGTKSGTGAAERAGNAAAGEVQAATSSVSPMGGRKIQEAFKPKYNKALSGGKIDAANEINAHVKKSMEEIGEGFTGKQQLARKEFLEQEGKSAMGAANPNMTATNPQLANIERKAIVQNMRQSPAMEKALNESQAMVGVGRAAKATQHSTLLNRLAHGGIWNAGRSPAALSGAGILTNEAGKALQSKVLRALILAELGQ